MESQFGAAITHIWLYCHPRSFSSPLLVRTWLLCFRQYYPTSIPINFSDMKKRCHFSFYKRLFFLGWKYSLELSSPQPMPTGFISPFIIQSWPTSRFLSQLQVKYNGVVIAAKDIQDLFLRLGWRPHSLRLRMPLSEESPVWVGRNKAGDWVSNRQQIGSHKAWTT